MQYVLRIILFLSLSLTHSVFANDTNPVERYGILPSIQKMSISPDGTKIAYRHKTESQDIVNVLSIDPVEVLSTINVSAVKPNWVNFVDNKNLLLRVSDEARIRGFKSFEASTALGFNIEKKSIRQLLTPGKDNIYKAQTGLGRVLGLSPDKKWAFMPAFYGDAMFVGGKQLTPPVALFKVKLNGGRVKLHKMGVDNTTDFFLNDEGKVVAVEAFDTQNNLHKIFTYPKKKAVEIFSEETPYSTKDFIGLSADDKSLVLLDRSDESGRSAIFHLNLKSGDIKGPLYDRNDADINRVVTDWQRKALGVQYSGFTPSYTFFEPDLNTRVQDILAQFPSHSVWINEISPDTNHILVFVEGPQIAGDYFLFSKGKNLKYVASSRSNIASEDIHPIGKVTFKARDGLKIPTLITIPQRHLGNMKNMPAVIMPHGGPASYDTIGFDYMAQAMAEQGYLVIQPQFRGSSGFGREHAVAGYGEWGGKMQDDLSDAIDFFSQKGIIDSERVCIVGASYGGYAALAGGAFTPDLYKCVVSENGIGNLKSLLTWVRFDYGGSSETLAYWKAQIKGFDSQSEDIVKQRSPEFSAEAFKAPVLLIYSEKDSTVPPRQSVTMYNALKKAGKSVEVEKLKGDDHYLQQYETRIQALQATIAFVNKHLQPKN